MKDVKKNLKVKAETLKVSIPVAVVFYAVAAWLCYMLMPQWHYLNPSTYVIGICLTIPVIFGVLLFVFHEDRRYYDLSDTAIRAFGWTAGITAVLLLIILVISSFGWNLYKSTENYAKVSSETEIMEESVFPELIKGDDTSSLPLFGEAEAQKRAEAELAKKSGLGSQTSITGEFMSQEINGEFVYVGQSSPNSVFKRHAENQYYLIDRNTGDSKSFSGAEFGVGHSRYFSENIRRYMIKTYDGEGFLGDIHLEITDDGKPFYVASVLTRNRFGGLYLVKGIVTCDPVTKEIDVYDMKSIPEWVDRVYPEPVLISYMEIWGKYKHGFKNAHFAKKDVLEPSTELNNEGYVESAYEVIFINGEPCIYTGMQTSNASSDSDANGILIANLKTGELTYYNVSGVSESHAQSVAQGLCSDKGYAASFPIPLKINGIEALFSLMRDENGNITGYALVSYEDYTKAAYATTLSECIKNFLGNVGYKEESTLSNKELKTIKGVVDEIATEVIDGRTTYYFKVKGEIFTCNSKANIDVVFTEEGDMVILTYAPSKGNVHAIKNFELGEIPVK